MVERVRLVFIAAKSDLVAADDACEVAHEAVDAWESLGYRWAATAPCAGGIVVTMIYRAEPPAPWSLVSWVRKLFGR